MSDLFVSGGLADDAPRPLADRLRPQALADVVGQDHLLNPEGPLGRVVANGTPEELKARSARAGAVLVTLQGASADAVKDKFSGIAAMGRIEVLSAQDGQVVLEAFPAADAGTEREALAGRIAELAIRENWKIQQLKTEEGRLEEVFRSITMPDTDTTKGTS